MKSLELFAIIAFVLLLAPASAAGGSFGPPQPIVKGAGGLHTGIGYWFQEGKYINDIELVTRQNQIYSELGYGSVSGWEVTARVGRSDLKLVDAFSPQTGSTSTVNGDFEGNAKFFGTVGARGFYPVSKGFGIGAFVQGTYYFSDFTDTVSGSRSGIPFSASVRIKKFWEMNFGIGLQAILPGEIKMYVGPHLHHSEFKASLSADAAGLALASGETILRSKSDFGGFAGIEVQLAKGFRLNLEGQYTERLSAGLAVIYLY